MSDRAEILKHATEILEKSGINPIYTLTVQEFEVLVKASIYAVLNKEPQKIPDDKLLTRQEVCSLLRVSYPTLLGYEKRGLVTGRRAGHRILFTRDDVLKALKKIKMDRNNYSE